MPYKNPEDKKRRDREYYKETIELQLARARQRYVDNPEREKLRARLYYGENSDAINAKTSRKRNERSRVYEAAKRLGLLEAFTGFEHV